jgi:DeoR family transcriptional regulator, aga operon transcriptional repressor
MVEVRALTALERRDKTLRMLQDEGRVLVADLSDHFGISAVTIRKDLAYLEDRGMLSRTHGGAVLPNHFVPDQPIEQKAKLHGEEKQRIGQAAGKIVTEGDSVILDAGSTTFQVARHLQGRGAMMVATNSVKLAMELSIRVPNVDLIMLGGMLRASSASVVGSHAGQMLRDYRFDKLFLGVDGFDLQHGLTTTHPMEAELNRVMIDAATETIVVTDSSKFGRRGLSRICGAADIHTVITDVGAPAETVTKLEERGVRVILV